jgi:hypothetical protein
VEEKSEKETSVKEGGKQIFPAEFLFGLFFDPEDGGYMFFRNVG